MNRTLKLSFLCAGIFLSGVVAGGYAMRHFGRGGGQPRMDSFGPQQTRRLTEGLDLTKEQRNAIRPILQKAGEDLLVMRKESIGRATQVIEAMDMALNAQLKPEQRERLVELRKKERVRMKASMEERQRRQSEREAEASRNTERRRENDPQRRPPPAGETTPPPAPPPGPEDSR